MAPRLPCSFFVIFYGMLSRTLAVLVLIFMLGTMIARGRVYTIPENWTATISGNKFPVFKSSGSYVLVSAPRNSEQQEDEFVMSENGIYGLAFLDANGTGHFYLSIVSGVLNASSRSGAPIWTANRARAISSQQPRLTKTNGQLKLLDGLQTVWSPSDLIIQSISLEETGNLKLYSSSGRVVWQSFDYPTDVLVPGQKLITGQKLSSNINSSTMLEGDFTATMEVNGIVLSFKQQPYFVWGLQRAFTTDSAKTPCPGYTSELQYNGNISMIYTKESPDIQTQPCAPSSVIQVTEPQGMSWHLRIESDGSLISYSLNKTGDWEVEIRIMEIASTTQACDLPLACGSYGLCRNPSNCSCLNEVSGIALTQAGKCGAAPTWPTRRENCDNNYKTDFVTLHGVRYFTNLYTSPDRVSSSLEECLGSCRTNCSCSALFYDATPRNCYFVNDVFGSLREGVPSYTAYLKFQDRSQLINTRRKFSKRKIDIIITISSVTAATVLVVCLLLLLRRKLVITRKQKEETENLVTALQGLPQRFTYRTLMLATKGFSKQLGTGGFGSVYEGVLPDGRKLAIKKLHSYSAQKEFIAEVTSLGRTSHVNIVQLCGYCAELSHRLLVYEFMQRGSLDKWIFRSQRAALSWNCRYNIALGTARGLSYLHEESREPIIHLDIKPQNILLGDNFEPKVADFGMAKLLMSRDVSMFTTGVRGTPGYLAPEWLMHSAVTKKCDVYGITGADWWEEKLGSCKGRLG